MLPFCVSVTSRKRTECVSKVSNVCVCACVRACVRVCVCVCKEIGHFGPNDQDVLHAAVGNTGMELRTTKTRSQKEISV